MACGISRLGVKLEPRLRHSHGSRSAASATDNTGSLTHWVRPRIKPTFSWMLVKFVIAKPWGELLSQSLYLVEQFFGEFLFFFFFFFFFFEGCPCSRWRFPGSGSNWSCYHGPTPEPQQRQILNPLNKAGDRTHNFMVPSWVRFCCAMTGTPIYFSWREVLPPEYMFFSFDKNALCTIWSASYRRQDNLLYSCKISRADLLWFASLGSEVSFHLFAIANLLLCLFLYKYLSQLPW